MDDYGAAADGVWELGDESRRKEPVSLIFTAFLHEFDVCLESECFQSF